MRYSIVHTASVLLLMVFLAFPSFVSAAPNFKSVSRLERNISRLQKRLDRKFDRLSAANQLRVIQSRSGKSDDSDLDGVPDNFESESGRCDSDSDDDGVTDGNEYENGTDPDDGSDGGGFEVHGILQAKTANSVTVGGVLYTLNSSTEYLDDDNNAVSLDSFDIGDCIEVEGHNSGSEKIVEKIKSDDDC